MKKHELIRWTPSLKPRLFVSALALSLVALVGCTDGALSIDGNYVDGRIGNLPTGGDQGPPAPGRVSSGGLSVEVSSPLPGTIITTPAIPVQGKASGMDSVLVNGAKVEVVDGAFRHNVPTAGEGDLSIVVEAEKLPKLLVPVVVDLTAPILEISSPPRGAFLVQGQQDRITVKGVATDVATGIKEVSVNGQIAQLSPNGSFTVEVTPTVGTNLLEVEAEDGAGKKTSNVHAAVYGQFAEWGRPSDNAINARLRADALGVLEDGIVSGLGGDLLGGVDLGGGGGDIEVRGMSYGELDIDLVPRQGYFDTTIRIYDLVIEIATKQRVLFFDVTITGDISTDPAELTGKLTLRPDGQGGLSMDLTDVAVQLHDFDLNLDGLAGIIDGLIEGMVEDMATEMLLGVLNGGGLGDLVGGGGEPLILDILGQQAELAMLITQLDIDPGGITFGTDATFTLPASPDVPPSPGTLKTPNPVPTGDGGKMVRLSLTDDFVNQILGSLWRSGALNVDVGAALAESEDGGLPLDLNAGTFSLLVGDEILAFADDKDTPVGLVLRPLLPPVATIENPEDGIMHVIVGDMLLDFTLEKADGSSVHWASVSTHLTIDVKIGLGEDGEADVQLSMDVVADLADEPLFDIDDATLEQVIASMIGGLGDSLSEGGLGGLLGGGSGGGLFGDTPGVGIASMDVRNDGPAQDFMSFYVDLLIE